MNEEKRKRKEKEWKKVRNRQMTQREAADCKKRSNKRKS